MSAHRVLGRRVCECGCDEPFTVTTKKPDQRFKNRAHADRGRSLRMEAQRARAVKRQREERFGRMIAARMDAHQRISRSELLALCAETFRLGYQAGFRKRLHDEEKAA